MELSFRTKPACRFEQAFIDWLQYSDISEICNQIIYMRPNSPLGAELPSAMCPGRRSVLSAADGRPGVEAPEPNH